MEQNSIPKKGLAGLKAHFKDDLISGFSVSLIALPLCLGIAIASGVPPLAGLITAIVGGILASRIAGSFVTISGPAAGLIVITLGAAEALGGAGAESGYAGYPYAIAAIVLGGAIMALFGVFKIGKVGDYFPSAAVHGMLAAIGITIIVKQFFPAIGVAAPKGELFELMADIPHALTEVNPYIGIIALVSVAILVVHPFIKNGFIKAIPAPMWVLIATIPMAFGFDMFHEHSYSFMGHTYSIGPNYLVDMPESILGPDGIKFPDFSKIGESAFWIAVVSVALVSAIESLLSAKAVDTLDPYKRKSNLDKDLIAMGGGSALAGAIGGLPMISEIVRSSANVNNGAKTQWANFFHGVFLLIFTLVGVKVIEMIPLAALAAMLVYTGFKLASPKEFKHMYHIGLAELEIFVVTLVAVLATDLVIGIVVGILFKYVLVLFKGAPAKGLFKVKADVQRRQQTATIRPESNALLFSNYLSLKAKLDKARASADHLQLDLSNVSMIDHTTMHHLEDYERDLKLEGKTLQLLNIEKMNPVSAHPLSERRLTAKAQEQHEHLSKRQLSMFSLATVMEGVYLSMTKDFESWEFYSVSIRKKITSVENIIRKYMGKATLEVADIHITEGAELSESSEVVTALKMTGLPAAPKFFMAKETQFERVLETVGVTDEVDFKHHRKFSKDVFLKGENKAETESFFRDGLLDFFEANPGTYLVSNGHDFLLHKGHKRLDPDEIKELMEQGQALVPLLQ